MRESCGVRTLTLLSVTLALYLLLWQALVCFFELPVYYYGRLIELLATVLFAALAFTTPMKFEEMGIIVPRLRLFRSLLLGAAVGLLFLGALALIQLFKTGDLAFSWHIRGDISRITYFLVAPFQEVLAKSVMLYSFELVFEKKHPVLALFMSALTFGAFHVVYGIRMMLLAMLLSFITGLIFYRERCVWGCAVAHFACGFFPVCLGF